MKPRRTAQSSATIGFEAKLWLTADKFRNNMDAADWSGATKSLPQESPEGERGGAHQYKHVVLGLIEMLAPYKGRIYDPACGSGGRRKQTLFIDARKLGTLIDRIHRELTDADLEKITSTYQAWRSGLPSPTGRRAGDEGNPGYEDAAGFCKSATTAEIAAHGHVLTPGRYVGAEEVADDGDPFEEKMPRLVSTETAAFSANGAAHTSPGQRPGSAPSFHQALKGRHNRCLAPSWLGMFLGIEPRALPWAGMGRPFGAAEGGLGYGG